MKRFILLLAIIIFTIADSQVIITRRGIPGGGGGGGGSPAIVDSTSVGDNGGGTSLESASFTVSGENRVLYVMAGSGASSPVTANSVEWGGSGGTSLTQISTTLNMQADYGRMTLWRLIAPTAQTSTVYVTWGSSQDERWIIAFAIENCDQSTPNNTIATATGTNAAPTVNAISSANDLVLDFMSWLELDGDSYTCTIGANQVQSANLGGGAFNPNEGAGASHETATGASTTMSWTISGTGYQQGWGIYAFSLNAP